MINPESIGLRATKSRGKEALVYCPFHNDKRPSAWFNTSSGLFYCFACGASGNAESVAKHNGFESPEILPWSDGNSGVEFEADDYDWSSFLRLPVAYHNPYLKSRKVNDCLVEKYDIRSSDRHIVIPVRNARFDPIGVIVRQLEAQPKYLVLGKRTHVWPIQNVLEMSKGDDVLYVTEGVFGALRLETLGNVNSVATLGANAVSKFIEFYNVNIGLMYGRVIAIMDCDFAGQVAAAKLAIAGIPVAVGHKLPPDKWEMGTWEKLHHNPQKLTTTGVKDIAKTVAPDRLNEFWSVVKSTVKGRL